MFILLLNENFYHAKVCKIYLSLFNQSPTLEHLCGFKYFPMKNNAVMITTYIYIFIFRAYEYVYVLT